MVQAVRALWCTNSSARTATVITTVFASLVATTAVALAPCPRSCHLGQGTPILLVETDQLLTTRCDKATSKQGVLSSNCVTERLSLDGTLLETFPHPPTIVGGDREFEAKYFQGVTTAELGWRGRNWISRIRSMNCSLTAHSRFRWPRTC